MRLSEILKKLGKLSPWEDAENWDNVGLLVGRPEKKVKTVYLAVDATDEVIDHGVSKGADLIITHHPMIFKPMKRVVSDDFVARRVMELIKRDVACTAMHTNFDINCMGSAAAEKLGLKDTEVLQVTHAEGDDKKGFGSVGLLPKSMHLGEFAEYVKRSFELEHVKIFGNLEEVAERVAVLPGSGGSCIGDAIRMDADVLLTGDISHHEGLDANMQGLSIIDAGHYGIEKIFTGYMRSWFRRELPEITVFTEEDREPFRVL